MDKLQLEIPEGMVIDIENSDLSKGVIRLKAKDEQKKWEDFGEVKGYYINNTSSIIKYEQNKGLSSNINTIPTRSLAKAMLALCQLLQWRNKVWEEDNNWKPNWERLDSIYSIYSKGEEIDFCNGNPLSNRKYQNSILMFSTEKIRDKFYKDHRDLIEQAKELL